MIYKIQVGGKEPWLVGLHKLNWQTFFSADPLEGLPANLAETF
jgi:hypothetical protein